jgi:hypothetical protein
MYVCVQEKGIKVKNANSLATQVQNVERKPRGRDEILFFLQ